MKVDVVYTDFSKAFDKMSHSILINKLKEVGIHGDLLRWLSSDLQNHSQTVTVNVHCSSSVPITSGVPQGTHLGPLLFKLYINDVIHIILLFADDMKVCRRISSISDTFTRRY